MFQVPAFWKSDLGTVERLAQMCGAREFGRSAGDERCSPLRLASAR